MEKGLKSTCRWMIKAGCLGVNLGVFILVGDELVFYGISPRILVVC